MENEKEFNERVKVEVDKRTRLTVLFPLMMIAVIVLTIWMLGSGTNYQNEKIASLEKENEILKYQNKYNLTYYYNHCSPKLRRYIRDTFNKDTDINYDYAIERDALLGIRYSRITGYYYGILNQRGLPDYNRDLGYLLYPPNINIR